MSETRIALNTLGPEGGTFTVDDPAVWSGPLAECGMVCRIVRPLTGTVTLLPQEGGCLARGRLSGEIVIPCDRCAEDSTVVIDQRFESFEPLPEETPDGGQVFDNDADEMVIRPGKDGSPEFDLGGLLWEEFVLAVPVKPLCRPDCKGICPVCGKNRNEDECACSTEEGDPRLAPLRDLHIKRR